MARENGLKRTSEARHRNRLWWTMYMQERQALISLRDVCKRILTISRRIATATGNPPGISDEAISTPLPAKAPGFQSVEALKTNIRLARITGSISQGTTTLHAANSSSPRSDIYSCKNQSERDFVMRTQSILSALVETQKNMPSEYAIVLASEPHIPCRTAATLHLMLFQVGAHVPRVALVLTSSGGNSCYTTYSISCC